MYKVTTKILASHAIGYKLNQTKVTKFDVTAWLETKKQSWKVIRELRKHGYENIGTIVIDDVTDHPTCEYVRCINWVSNVTGKMATLATITVTEVEGAGNAIDQLFVFVPT